MLYLFAGLIASGSARAWRVLERGPFASFANCGLPYFVGGVIEQEDDLLVAKGPLFKERFAIDLRTQNEVVAIDRGVCGPVERRGIETDVSIEQAVKRRPS